LNPINAADQQAHPLTRDAMILGRSKQVDLVLRGDGVSREDARLRADENGYILTDTSCNYTYLNNQKLQHEVRLTPGDHIRMGETIPEGESYGTARLEAWIA
jgi:predicted component of type VI protein secretion system